MTFIASRLFGLLIVVVAIGVVIVLWVQCSGNGCAFSAPVKTVATPIVTPEGGFGTLEIHIDGLTQGAQVVSPLTITGKAIPDWYIGGQFTVRLLDAAGHGLAYTQAKPTTQTAVNGYIPFTATIPFFPTTPQGTLIVEKNLGSGLPDFPSTVALPLSFPNYVVTTPTPQPIQQPTITPSPSATPATMGILQGSVTISPICPTTQSGKACTPSVKMFADRPISVQSEDKSKLIATIIPGPTGQFAQELPAGTYFISMLPQIMGSITGVPANIKITAGKTSTLNIAIDTGIQTPENTATGATSGDGF